MVPPPLADGLGLAVRDPVSEPVQAGLVLQAHLAVQQVLAGPCIPLVRTPVDRPRVVPVHGQASERVLGSVHGPALVRVPERPVGLPLREHPERPSQACARRHARVLRIKSATKRAKKAQ